MKYCIISFLCSAFLISVLSAQQMMPAVISSDGGNSPVARIQLDWTLGELAIEGLTGQPKSYTEGFHQPILSIDPIIDPDHQEPQEETESLSNISLTPNPVSSHVTIRFKFPADKEIHYQVGNANGYVHVDNRVNTNNGDVELDFSGFVPGMYFIHFRTDDGSVTSTFKISKIK